MNITRTGDDKSQPKEPKQDERSPVLPGQVPPLPIEAPPEDGNAESEIDEVPKHPEKKIMKNRKVEL